MNIPSYIINIAISVIIYLILFAVSYGKILQRQKDTEERIGRLEDSITDLKYEIKDVNKNFDGINKQLSKLEGTLETFIKLVCMKEGLNE